MDSVKMFTLNVWFPYSKQTAVSSCMTVLTTSLGGSWNGRCRKGHMVRQTMIHINMKLILMVIICPSSASSAGTLSRILL